MSRVRFKEARLARKCIRGGVSVCARAFKWKTGKKKKLSREFASGDS